MTIKTTPAYEAFNLYTLQMGETYIFLHMEASTIIEARVVRVVDSAPTLGGTNFYLSMRLSNGKVSSATVETFSDGTTVSNRNGIFTSKNDMETELSEEELFHLKLSGDVFDMIDVWADSVALDCDYRSMGVVT